MEDGAHHPTPRPATAGGNTWALLTGLSGVGTAGWLLACAGVWPGGHPGLGTESYGATWGITVANVLHLIGISHVGIAVSAAVRILGLRAYRNVARLAELVTVVALSTAVLDIAVDVGRPDRFLVETLRHGRWHAPMVWSMTVITAYFLASGVYLYLSIRRDLAVLATTDVRRPGVYRALALGYGDTPAERLRHERTLFGLAVLLVPIMVSVHSVYGLFFGLLRARPGWFNPLQAPYFVLGAVVSGFSAILVLAALVRRAHRWRAVFDDRTFRVFGSLLAFVVFLHLYFTVSEHLTAQYAGPAAERAVSTSLLAGPYAPAFWLTAIGGLLVPFLVLFVQALRPSVSVGLVAAAALAVNVAMWSKRFLLIVPAQLLAHLPPPRPLVAYGPTAFELVATFGTYAFAALLFLVLLRWIPLVELAGTGLAGGGPARAPPVLEDLGRSRGSLRQAAVLVEVLLGSFFLAWGLAARASDQAPMKWLAGIVVLAAIPMTICLIPDAREARDAAGPTEVSP